MSTGGDIAGPALPEGGVFYYWPRGFLLLVPSFVLVRGEHMTRRPSIRLMLARRGPFDIEFADGSQLTAQAVLMGPQVRRRRMIARDKAFVLLDVAVSTPEYAALEPLIAEQGVAALDVATLSPLFADVEQAALGQLTASEVTGLRRRMVRAITGHWPADADHDPRIEAALALIHEQRLEDLALDDIAGRVHLSPDRLRHLFRQQVGCTVSHYARTSAVWKALTLWSEGMPLTGIAHEVGFHDYSHFHHAFRDMFGFKPSVATGGSGFRMIRC